MPPTDSAVERPEILKDPDDEIRETWEDLQSRVRLMAGEAGKNYAYRKNMKIDDVRICLGKAQELQTSNKDGSDTMKAVKKNFDRTLLCIQTLGEVVIGPVSGVVGGSANTCYNALTFVIVAYQSYNSMFEILDGLLRKCLRFLDRLECYSEVAKDTIIPKLKLMACRQLKFFIKVCEHTLKLRRKRYKVQAFIKITLLKDDEVKALLEEEENLTVEEFEQVVLDTWSETHRIGKTVDEFKSQYDKDSNDRKADMDERKWRSRLIAGLGWPKELPKADGSEAPILVWRERYIRHLRRVIFEEHGKWLENAENFVSWARDKTCQLPVLGIEGDEGTGKTHLAARYIQYLQQSEKQSYVAYYFMENDQKPAETDIGILIARSLLWQLADSSRPFLKSTTTKCGDDNRKLELDNILNLLVSSVNCDNVDTKFFIVVDGLAADNAHIKFAKSLLTQMERRPAAWQNLRILFTGTPSFFEAIGSAGDIGMVINLKGRNLPDIQRFVDNRMEKISTLRGQSDRVVQMRKMIHDKLGSLAGGNYRKMELVFNEIKRQPVLTETRVDRCLEGAGNASTSLVSKIIQSLNETSTADEISEINEMILWVLNGRGPLNVQQITAALSLKLANAAGSMVPPGNRRAITARRLKANLRNDKYLLFDLNNADELRFRDGTSNEDAKQGIHTTRPAASVDGDARRGMSTSVQPSEVNLVKHYLQNCCPEDLYAKFEFAEFFEKKLANRGHIHRDPANAELLLSLRCLTCLIEGRDGETQAIHSYATENLYAHLHSATYDLETREDESSSEKYECASVGEEFESMDLDSDSSDEEFDSEDDDVNQNCLSSRDPVLRTQVAALLSRLFHEDYAIDSFLGIHCSPSNQDHSTLLLEPIPSRWTAWVTDDTGLNLLRAFCRDRHVRKRLGRREFSQLRKPFNTAIGNQHLDLLRPSLKRAVSHLLNPDATYHEIHNSLWFLVVAEAQFNSKDKRSFRERKEHLSTQTAERVKNVEDWALEMTAEKLTSVWTAHVAVILLRLKRKGCANISDADIKCRTDDALERDPSNWQASFTQALVTESNKEASLILAEIIGRSTAHQSYGQLSRYMQLQAEVYLEQGERQRRLGNHSKAIESYLTSVKMDPSHHDQYLDMILECAEGGRWGDIASLMKALLSVHSKQHGNPIGKVVIEGIQRQLLPFRIALVWTAKETEDWHLLKRVYRRSLKENSPYEVAVGIRSSYAFALARSPESQHEALKVWKDISHIDPPAGLEYFGRGVIEQVVVNVMPMYTTRRRTMKTAEADCNYDVEELRKKFLGYHGKRDLIPLSVLYFSRYYFLCDEIERARELAGDLLSQSLEMMLNDDPTDDFWCFWQLQSLFWTFNDIENAVAAMRMVVAVTYTEYLEETAQWCAEEAFAAQTPADNTEHKSSKPTYDIGINCDGCGAPFKSACGMWTCIDDCGQVQFDNDCYMNLMQGTLKKDVCSKDHRFYQFSEHEVGKVQKMDGLVKVKWDVMPLEDWAKTIKLGYQVRGK